MQLRDPDFSSFPAAVEGQFTIERELGRGGMGVVFLARDVRLDRAVAIKVLPPHLAADGALRERFLREARTAGQLSHPNIVPIYRADERDGYAYFAMAFVEGESLADKVRERGALAPADAVRWLREVAWALAYAHARGVVHRDVKPENIMIERGSNRALVTDFGIARHDALPGITSEGHVVGTANFMSPEQIEGRVVDGRSDLYSLGVAGFYVLSGCLPFAGDGAREVLLAHLTKPAPPLGDVAPAVPASIAAVIDRSLAKDPAQRYANGETLADALTKALDTSAAELAGTSAAASFVLSEEQAGAVWKRAAQLQAEAAARLERDSRDAVATSTQRSLPTEGYRARDVEAAAIEAGISKRFVDVALAELQRGGPVSPAISRGWSDAVARWLIGGAETVRVSRVIHRPPAEALRALGPSFAAGDMRLQLRETIGPHPLDGGVLVFDLALSMTLGQRLEFETRIVGSKERIPLGRWLSPRISLHRIASDPGACEVVIEADIRPGKRRLVGGLLVTALLTPLVLIGGVNDPESWRLFAAVVPIMWGIEAVAARLLGRRLAPNTTGLLESILAALDLALRRNEIFSERLPSA